MLTHESPTWRSWRWPTYKILLDLATIPTPRPRLGCRRRARSPTHPRLAASVPSSTRRRSRRRKPRSLRVHDTPRLSGRQHARSRAASLTPAVTVCRASSSFAASRRRRVAAGVRSEASAPGDQARLSAIGGESRRGYLIPPKRCEAQSIRHPIKSLHMPSLEGPRCPKAGRSPGQRVMPNGRVCSPDA